MTKEIGMEMRREVWVLVAIGLLFAGAARSAPVGHTLTLVTDSIDGTPFGLTSVPGPLRFAFAVDDSILGGGDSMVYEALPGFVLLEPMVIGDATFTNAEIPVAPGGRVTDGLLMEIYLLAQYVDPIEGQREIRTYFMPANRWDGTDFNPEPPSEFMFGSYSIALAPPTVPEPGSLVLMGLGLAGLVVARRTRRPRRRN